MNRIEGCACFCDRSFLKCCLHYTKYVFEISRVQVNTRLVTGFAFTKGLLALDFEVRFLEKYVYFSLTDEDLKGLAQRNGQVD